MTQLTRYSLDAKKILKYIHWNLENGNALSLAVLKHVDFTKGEFFTFLKKGLPKDVVNEPRNIHVGIDVKEKVTNYLFDELKLKKDHLCIFDDDEEDYKEEGNWDLYNQVGVHFNKEMYYLLQHDQVEKDLISECLYASDIIWHSLCIVSKYPYSKNKDQSISNKDLESIVKEAEIILVLAYDAEGYVIWKRNSLLKSTLPF